MPGMHLFLIDPDRRPAAKMCRALADEHGFVVATFRDAAAAVQRAFESPPDGVLLAVDREETYLQLRRLRHELPEVPIIVASRRNDAAAVRRALIAGATDYLVEPSAGEVAYALLRTLERFRRARRSA